MSTDNPPLEQPCSVGLASTLKVTKPSDRQISPRLFVQHRKEGFPPSFRPPYHLLRGSGQNYLGSPWIITCCRDAGGTRVLWWQEPHEYHWWISDNVKGFLILAISLLMDIKRQLSYEHLCPLELVANFTPSALLIRQYFILLKCLL